MKLSEFLSWWGAFIQEHCDGLTASLRVPSAYTDLIVFKLAKDLVINGKPKRYQLERAYSIQEIEAEDGLRMLGEILKIAIRKIKEDVTHD